MQKIKIKLSDSEMDSLVMMLEEDRTAALKRMLEQNKLFGVIVNSLLIEITVLLMKKLVDQKKKYTVKLTIAQAAVLKVFLSTVEFKGENYYEKNLVQQLESAIDKQFANLSVTIKPLK
jgi:predicted membrane chloride channel (bestrophin family)